MNIKTNQKGMTLIELLMVIVIISILSAIAIPSYIGVISRSMRSEAKSNLTSLRLVLESYFAENGCYYRDGVCKNSTALNTTVLIKNQYPSFKPGDTSQLKFTYKIEFDNPNPPNLGAASCFTATATGTDKHVLNEIFTINCRNERSSNF